MTTFDCITTYIGIYVVGAIFYLICLTILGAILGGRVPNAIVPIQSQVNSRTGGDWFCTLTLWPISIVRLCIYGVIRRKL